MSRQKTEVNNLADNEKAASFKISGLIVLCVFGVLLFGLNPQTGANPMNSTAHLMMGTIGQAICNIAEPLLNFFGAVNL